VRGSRCGYDDAVVPRLLLALIALTSGACSYPAIGFAENADTDPAVVDAPGDAEPFDGTADADHGDSGSDAAPETTDAGDPRGCAESASLFCDDFDGVTTPDQRWDGFGKEGAGEISLISTSPYSPPQAFMAEFTAVLAGVHYANLGKKFTAPAPNAMHRVDFRMYLEAAVYPAGPAILVKVQRDTSGGRGVALMLGQNGFEVEVYGTSYTLYPVSGASIPTNRWIHVRFESTFDVTNGSYRLFVDDMVNAIAERTALATIDMASTSRELIVGLYADRITQPLRVRYDDVTLDFFTP
jgi:hypothetical protein